MKTKFLLTFIFIGFSITLFAQGEKLNQNDSNGKKDGKWIVYLDANWKETKGKEGAVYYRYTYYDHGVNIFPMGPCGKKNWKLTTPSADSTKSSEPKMLNGEYKWYDDKGKLVSTHVLKDGEYVSCKEYHSNGNVSQFFDYTRQYKAEPHTYCVILYDKDGKQSKFFVMRNGPKGWILYPGSEDDLKK